MKIISKIVAIVVVAFMISLAAIAFAALSPEQSENLSSLNRPQAALYVSCLKISGADGASAVSADPAKIGTMMQAAQATAIPALKGLSRPQLQQASSNAMARFAHQSFGSSPNARSMAYQFLQNQDQPGCLATAQWLQ